MPTQILLTRPFHKFIRKERITSPRLVEAIIRAEDGLIDADLGGGLIKQRVARPGSGRSSGYRTIIAFRSENRAVFLHGFAKNDKGNISQVDLAALRVLADGLFAASREFIERAISDGELIEIALTDMKSKKKQGSTIKESLAVYGSPILESVHEAAAGLTKSGLVSKRTMRELDALCLTPVKPIEPDSIRALREREGVSQAVLAHYINVSPNAVGQWERGEKRPAGASLKLLWIAMSRGLDAIR